MKFVGRHLVYYIHIQCLSVLFTTFEKIHEYARPWDKMHGQSDVNDISGLRLVGCILEYFRYTAYQSVKIVVSFVVVLRSWLEVGSQYASRTHQKLVIALTGRQDHPI